MDTNVNNGEVLVWLEGSLRKRFAGSQPMVFPAGRTIQSIIQELGISSIQPVAALVNGKAFDIFETLKPGDQVRLLPVISGGGNL